jgi:hypothetical protein
MGLPLVRTRVATWDELGRDEIAERCSRPAHAVVGLQKGLEPINRHILDLLDGGRTANHVPAQPKRCHRDRTRSLDVPR